MTTIAYRNGWIAADTGLSDGSTLDMFIDKVAKNAKGHVCGASGGATWIDEFLTWFKGCRVGDPPIANNDNGFAIVIEKPSRIFHFESIAGKTKSFAVRGPYHAIGSGSDFALGAMFAGASASSAVNAAMRHDKGTHGQILALRLGK